MDAKKYSLDEMKEKTIEFYNKYDIKINDMNLAIASLTMPEYANSFNQDNIIKIDNQDGLATVGDAICGAYLMKKKYKSFMTKEELTKLKDNLTNESLQPIGKELLSDYLFHINNDLSDNNTKKYATAFEAVVGFIALNNLADLNNFLSKFIDKKVL